MLPRKNDPASIASRREALGLNGDADLTAYAKAAETVTGLAVIPVSVAQLRVSLGEYELAECIAGLRPMTPDNLPLVGRLDARTLIAAGHGRSGFLLAPWTAEQIVSELIPVGART